MTEAHAQTVPDPQAQKRVLDTGLNVAVLILFLAVVGVGAYFGYSVWSDRQQTEAANPASRIIAAIEDQIRDDPNNVILRVRLGEALGASGKYPQAIEQLNEALKIDPNHVGAYLDLGMIARLTENYTEAEEYFNKVVELTEQAQYSNVDDRRENALYNLGLISLEQDKFDEAAGYFKAALRIRKDASDTYYNLAQALQGMEDTDGAMENLEIALAFDPGYAEAHYLMGQLFMQQEDEVNASYHFFRASELAPDADPPQEALTALGTPEEWLAKAEESFSDGDIEAALQSVLVARNIAPDSAEAAVLHGEILIVRGDAADALDVYEQAAELDPEDEEIAAKVAELKKQQEKE